MSGDNEGARRQPPPGFFSRVSRVMGRVVAAKGLPNTDRFSKSDPFCVIKAIRSNNHMANIFITKTIQNTLAPEWEEEFDYTVPEHWGLVELVGLKAMVYDADDLHASFQGGEDFLGGSDIDISNAASGRTVTHELELGGVPVNKARGRKPRLNLVITVYRDIVPKPPAPDVQLSRSLQDMTYVREVTGKVVGAKGLKNVDLLSYSDPCCIVRVVFMSGEVQEIHRTKIIDDTLDPEWNEEFQAKFEGSEQPLLILFDIFDADDPDQSAEEAGDHLGTAVVPLLQCLPPNPRKRKLLLQPESQRHETRLDKEGNARNGVEAEEVAEERKQLRLMKQKTKDLREKKESRAEKFIKMATSMRSKLAIAPVGNAVLTVEIRTRAKTEPMPHIDLLGKPVDVADEEDCRKALELEDWNRSMFDPPFELSSCPPPRGQLCAAHRIVFVYGRIQGASGLAAGDQNGRSDPYCVVEGLSRAGDKVFMHRTRVIKGKLCPDWGEAFYCAVPLDIEVNRLVFSVYDRDESVKSYVGLEEDNNDEFLGRATIDLSYLKTGEVIREDVPIAGSAVKNKVKVSTGFRRNPSVAIEVMIERRVQPFFGEAQQDHFAIIPRRKHNLSRQPHPARVFWDASQQLGFVPQVEEIATDVIEYYSTGQMLSEGRKQVLQQGGGDWVETREMQARNEQEQEREDAVEKNFLERKKELDRQAELRRRTREEIIPPGSDFTKRVPLPKSKSLPLLQTKFGQPENVFLQYEIRSKPPGAPLAQTLRQIFSAKSRKNVLDSFRTMWHNPDPAELVQRRPGTVSDFLAASRPKRY